MALATEATSTGRMWQVKGRFDVIMDLPDRNKKKLRLSNAPFVVESASQIAYISTLSMIKRLEPDRVFEI